MKKLIKKLTLAKKPTNLKEWKNPLLPMFYTLKVLGRLPFVKDESGNLNVYNLLLPTYWIFCLYTSINFTNYSGTLTKQLFKAKHIKNVLYRSKNYLYMMRQM